MRKIFKLLILLGGTSSLLATPLENGNWKLPPDGRLENGVLIVESEQPVSSRLARYSLPLGQTPGSIAELTGEYRTTGLEKDGSHPHGGKINVFFLFENGERKYFPMSLPTGTGDWRSFRLAYSIPVEPVKLAEFQLGLQQACGKVEFRNLKTVHLGTNVPLCGAANREWSDWTGAGPQDDGRFLRQAVQNKLLHSGYPFEVKTSGKSVLVMNQPLHFPAGPRQAVIRPEVPTRSKYLYLLHTASWMGKQKEFGEITVAYDSGEKEVIRLANAIDLADWSSGVELENGKIAVRAKSGIHPTVVLYASRFQLRPEAGKVTSITFTSLPEAPIWIIVGATLSDSDFVRKHSSYVIRQDQVWKKLDREVNNRRLAGSALDLNAFREDVPCGTYGRVILSPSGHFVFEKRPEKSIRFFSNTVAIGYLTKHEEIDIYVDELCKNGFNMLRLHFLDLVLSRKAKETAVPDPVMLDAFDYLVSRCKARGIYLNLDCMTSTIGYAPGEVWGRKNVISNKSRIYFEPEIRQQWIDGVRQILCRVNRYTGTRLAEDPVLALAVGYNEQEFGFIRPQPASALPAWREFLKRRYSTIENLKEDWGTRADSFTGFQDIPLYEPGMPNLESNRDFAAFASENEQNIMRFYREELHKMGFQGPLSGFNMLGSRQYLRLRKDFDYVSKNSYETLMSNHFNPGSVLSQESGISSSAKMLRLTLGARLAGKPFFVTEYGVPFWNRYRYEAAFTMGAYAAFQNFDGIAAFGDSYAYPPVRMIRPVRIYMDPIAVATEFLTFFLFQREDVRPSARRVVLQFPENELMGPGRTRSSLTFPEGLYGLMTGLECFLSGDNEAFKGDGLVLNSKGGSLTKVFDMYASTADEKLSDSEVSSAILKKNRILPPGNRSDGLHVFESDTGELYLNTTENFMSVNTPRFQGICAEAGATAELAELSILKMGKRGNLSLVSLDGVKPIRQAKQMILVYATNVLNDGMSFDSPEMRMLTDRGKAPALLETAVFRIRIRHDMAESLQLFPLDLKGARQGKVFPAKVSGEWAEFEVDTAKDGCAIFFEITAGKTVQSQRN